MIHGHSTIELTDVNTGEVERYEDDNLVTNGIKYYQMFYGIPQTVWKDVFSGIKIFENSITEDPNIVTAPPAANLIGYANSTADTTNNMRGLLNLSQSGVLDDNSGIKLTWDFAQSQCNGTIRCICLTPPDWVSDGKINCEMDRFSHKDCNDAYNMQVIDYDFVRRCAISFDYAGSQDGSRMHFTLNQIPYLYRGITDDVIGKKVGEFYVDIPIDFSNYKSVGNYVGSDESFYYFLSIKDYTNTKPYATSLTLIKIKKKSHEVTIQEFSFSDPAYPDVYFSTGYDSAVFNGYLYILHDKKEYFKFDMNDFSLKKVILSDLIASAFKETYSYFAVRKDCIVGTKFSLDTDDNIRPAGFYHTQSQNDTSFGIISNILDGVLFIGRNRYSNKYNNVLFYRAPIILTINNLSSPVTKTADKTMKITYILREDYGDTPTPQTP